MKRRLIDTPEAQDYRPDERAAVVNMVVLQVWFEWRRWVVWFVFIAAGAVAFRSIERLGLSLLVSLGVQMFVVISGALLWSLFSWRLHRWVLANRRDALLHAVRRAS